MSEKSFTYAIKENTEMTKPLECPTCKGHIQFDMTFIDQVDRKELRCPYCNTYHNVGV